MIFLGMLLGRSLAYVYVLTPEVSITFRLPSDSIPIRYRPLSGNVPAYLPASESNHDPVRRKSQPQTCQESLTVYVRIRIYDQAELPEAMLDAALGFRNGAIHMQSR